jgi:hypothetical protein
MGYFGHLYLVEVNDHGSTVKVTTSVLGADIHHGTAYFSWGAGDRPEGLHSYAEGTVFSDQALQLLPGYPLVESYDQAENRVLLEATFNPKHSDNPVLFHFSLPDRFVPRPNEDPLDQPSPPFVCRSKSRLTATYPVVGPATIRFWIARMDAEDSLDNYRLGKLLHPAEKRATRVEVEFNLGIFKLKLA